MPEGTRHARQLHPAKDVREPDGYAQRGLLPDKRPGTVASQAVVVRKRSPCQRKTIRAGLSGNPLNRGILCRAKGFILG